MSFLLGRIGRRDAGVSGKDAVVLDFNHTAGRKRRPGVHLQILFECWMCVITALLQRRMRRCSSTECSLHWFSAAPFHPCHSLTPAYTQPFMDISIAHSSCLNLSDFTLFPPWEVLHAFAWVAASVLQDTALLFRFFPQYLYT